MSTRDGTIQVTSNLDPTAASSGKGRVYWRDDLKEFWQIDDAGIKSSLSGAVAWGNIGGELSDQTELYQLVRTELVIKSLTDIAQFLVGSSYELPAGRYVFDQALNIGLNNFKLITVNGFYTFKFSDINQVTYTGTASMFEATLGGQAIKMDDGFLSVPNGTCFEMTNANSLILTLVIVIAQKVASLTNVAFVTLNDLPLVGSGDGLTCTNCGTITAKLLQWNSGAGTGGSALRVTGASSDRLIMSTCDARPVSTEAFLDIDTSYSGEASIAGGVFDISVGGVFFKATGLDQTTPRIFAAGVVHVPMSRTEIFGHFAGNSTETAIAIVDTPVKINAGSGWDDIKKERFTFSSDGRWTYTGLEDIDVSLSLAATVNPSGGGTKSISTYFAKNGTVLPDTRGNVSASAGGQITNLAIVSLVTGDYIEAFLENNSDTANITVEVASIRIP